MIAAFGPDLNQGILRPRLEKESALDAYEALQALAKSSEAVPEETLQELLQLLHRPDRILKDDGD